MLPQLLLVKRLFVASQNFAPEADPVAAGMSVSLLQDAVELYVWTLVKNRDISVKDQSTFTLNLELLRRAGLPMPFEAKLLELNRARINFKHYGNLPAPSEAEKHRLYVEGSLRQAMQDHFGVAFDGLSLIDLIANPEICSLLKTAKASASADLMEAYQAVAQARVLAFRLANRILPSVDRKLCEADDLLSRGQNFQLRAFKYLTDYLGILREASLAAIFRMPVEDITFLRTQLPSAVQTGDGKWQFVHSRTKYTEVECDRSIGIIVTLCLNLQSR